MGFWDRKVRDGYDMFFDHDGDGWLNMAEQGVQLLYESGAHMESGSSFFSAGSSDYDDDDFDDDDDDDDDYDFDDDDDFDY